jgi:hypothetical protein
MTQSITENTTNTCSFPGTALRVYCLHLRDEMKRLEDGGESWPSQLHEVMDAHQLAVKLNHAHMDLTGCLCWFTDAQLAEFFRMDNYSALRGCPCSHTDAELAEMYRRKDRLDWLKERQQKAKDAKGAK